MSQHIVSEPLPDIQEVVTTGQRQFRRFNLNTIGVMTFLLVFTVYFLVPFFWLIVSSTKSQADLFGTFGLWFAPDFNLFTNLQQLFTFNDGIYARWLLNTLLYAGVGAVLGTFFASMAGYALTTLALPLYLLMSSVGLTNTYWSVLLPSLVSPFGVYLARIYAAAAVPDELLEAARIDGASEFGTFRIALHLMTPALVTILLFQFVAIWNNYFLPLVMLNDPNLFPITVGLQSWNVTTSNPSSGQTTYNLIVTGALLSSIPLLIGCIILQRFWRSGLGAGSVKG